MFSTLVSVALFAALAVQGAQAQSFTIDTPSLVQCQQAVITWSATSNPPYNLIVVPSDDPCGDPIEDLGDFYGTSTNWTVNVTSGTNVMFSLMDASGDEAWSGGMAVGGSGDASCLAASSSAASSSVAPTSSTVASSPAADVAPPSATTLFVSPEAAGTAAASRPAAASSSSGAVPVGAANAGDGPHENGAFSARQLSVPMLVLSALAAIALF